MLFGRFGLVVALSFASFATSIVLADGPADNVPAKVRPIPPAGVAIPAAQRAELEATLVKLDAAIEALKKSKAAADLVVDIEIYSKAVHWALRYNEFFKDNEGGKAKELLSEGLARAEALQAGSAPWTTQTGLVVRGYVSKIDGSIQPYGVVIPKSYSGTGPRVRLDIWLHGRGETLSEVNFLDGRRKQIGEFVPEDTIVLHPYGRYCNAFKFAGEIDVLESMAAVQKHYRVDEDRIAIRGFSMGGAGCWQLAVHYPSLWAAANPGAGFSETAKFLNVFQNEKVSPPEYQQKLWQWYDCPPYAVNLLQLPTVAYSGEIDKQKQAADVMESALKAEGIALNHIIGPNTAHKIHPDSKVKIETALKSIMTFGRELAPSRIRFTTPTLRYNRTNWLTVDGLEEHWTPASVQAEFSADGVLDIRTENVTALSIDLPAGSSTLPGDMAVTIVVDEGDEIEGPRPLSDRSWSCKLEKVKDAWRLAGAEAKDKTLAKRHGLQGPIDDAFLDSFLFVLPSGSSDHAAVNRWVKAESARAIREWRSQFRGDARVKLDRDVTDDDIAKHNLVLWGDAKSNTVLARIAADLPIQWTGDKLNAGKKSYAAKDHLAVLIYPSPLNGAKYVVVNSGMTFREYDYLSNARQVPKLPDWAIIDLNTPPDTQNPGKVVAADFFDESWKFKESN